MSDSSPAVDAVERDSATDAFFDGTARGELLLKRCSACGRFVTSQARQCSYCHGVALIDAPAAGTARVVSWAVPHSKPRDGLPAQRRVIVIAELAEGPWWWGALLDADPDDVRVGMPLVVGFERGGPESEAVPVFRPA